MEIWGKIKNYENYEVSNQGRVRNTKNNKILKLAISNKGYERVWLCKNSRHQSFRVHRLVTFAFIGRCPKGKECNHKDGNKRNNNVKNLEWVTSQQNSRHASRNGLLEKSPKTRAKMSIAKQGENCYLSKLTDEMVRLIRRSVTISGAELSRMFSVSQVVISNIRLNKTWKHII